MIDWTLNVEESEVGNSKVRWKEVFQLPSEPVEIIILGVSSHHGPNTEKSSNVRKWYREETDREGKQLRCLNSGLNGNFQRASPHLSATPQKFLNENT